jgi:aminopeptidase N
MVRNTAISHHDADGKHRFANIVTMEWWTDLWLNEAFASYAADVVTGPMLDPDFETWLPFVDSNVEVAMQVDATESHPIVNEIVSEDQFGAAFDSITYLKGASGKWRAGEASWLSADGSITVLRQIAAVLGEKKFLKGVSNYLKKFAYQNAEGKDRKSA